MMTPTQFRQALSALGLSQSDAAKFLGVNLKTAWNWANDAAPIPEAVAKLLRVMVRKGITADELGKAS